MAQLLRVGYAVSGIAEGQCYLFVTYSSRYVFCRNVPTPAYLTSQRRFLREDSLCNADFAAITGTIERDFR
jgi:hypothetical protein